MKFGGEENFRLRLKEVDEVEKDDKKFIVYKRKRSGSYVPIYEKKSRKMKKEKTKECYFDILPDELCLRIYYFLTAKDICQGPCQVSWRLHSLSQNNILWKDLFSQELTEQTQIQQSQIQQIQTPSKTSHKTNWKSYYIKLYKKQNCPLLSLISQLSNINSRKITSIDQYDFVTSKHINLYDFPRLKFEDIFTKKLKWDVYITIGICSKPEDIPSNNDYFVDEYAQPNFDFLIPNENHSFKKINELRRRLEQAWKQQKLIRSTVKENLKESGWTILDSCSRRNSNSLSTIPKNAKGYLFRARVHRWDQIQTRVLVSNSVYIDYGEEDFSRDLYLLKHKFSIEKNKLSSKM